jgi:TP901 family phage tail tape measure protein
MAKQLIAGSMAVTLGFDGSQFFGGADAAEERLNGFGRSVKSVSDKSSASLIQMSIASGLLAAGLTASLKSAIDVFINFDRKMAMTGAIANVSSASLAEVGLTIRDLGIQTEYGAAKTAEAMTELLRLGYDTSQSFNILSSSVQLAASQQEDLLETSKMVSMQMKAYNMDTSESSRVTNLLAAVSTQTAADLPKLAVSMQYVSPAAAAMGISIEEVSAALGMMLDRGIMASRAGTGLRFALDALVTPTNELYSGLRLLNLTYDQVNPTTVSFTKILNTLGEAVKGNKDAYIAFSRIFGVRSATSMLAVANAIAADSNAFNNLKASISGTDEVSRLFGEQMGTLSFQFLKIKSLIEETKIGFGEGLKDALTMVANGVENLLLGFKELNPNIKKSIATVGLLSVGAISLTATLATLIWGIKAITAGLAAMRLMLISTGGLLTVGGIAAAAALALAATGYVSMLGAQKKAEEQARQEIKDKKTLSEHYIKLSDEQEKTTRKEWEGSIAQKELFTTSDRLAKLAPSVVDGFNSITGAVIINIDKVRLLNAEMDRLAKAEAINRISKTEKLLGEAQKKLSSLEDRRRRIEGMTGMGVKLSDVKEGDISGTGLLSAGIYEESKKAKLKGITEETQDTAKRVRELVKELEDLKKGTEDTGKVLGGELPKELESADSAYSKLQSKIDDFLEAMRDATAKYNREAARMGMTGYEAQIQAIKDTEEANKESLTRKLNDELRMLKKLHEKEKTDPEKLPDVEYIEKVRQVTVATNKAIVASNNKSTEEQKKLNKDYVKNVGYDLGDMIDTNSNAYDEIDSIFEASLDSRIRASERNDRRELEVLERQKKELNDKYTGEMSKDAEYIKLKGELDEQIDTIYMRGVENREKMKLDEFLALKKIEMDYINITERNEVAKAEKLKVIQDEITVKTKKAYGDQTKAGMEATNEQLQAKEDLRQAEIKRVTDVLSLTDELISGSAGELAGLNKDFQEFYSIASEGIVDMISSSFSFVSVAGLIVGIIGLITSNILSSRKEQEKLEEERKAAHEEAIKAQRELGTNWADIARSANDATRSVDDLTVTLKKSSDDLINTWNEQPDVKGGIGFTKRRDITDKQYEKMLEIIPIDKLNQYIIDIESGARTLSDIIGEGGTIGEAGVGLAIAVTQGRITMAEANNDIAFLSDILQGASGAMSEYQVSMVKSVKEMDLINRTLELLNTSINSAADFTPIIDSLLETSEIVDNNNRSIIDANNILDFGRERMRRSIQEAGDDPLLIAQAKKDFADLVKKLKESPAWEQIPILIQSQLEGEVVDLLRESQTLLTDGFQKILDEIENLISGYNDSIGKSVDGLTQLFNMGKMSFGGLMNSFNALERDLPNDLPKDLKDAIEDNIEEVRFDLVGNRITELTSSIDNLNETIKDNTEKVHSLEKENQDLASRKAFLENPNVPVKFETSRDVIKFGLTPAMEKFNIKEKFKEDMASVDKQITDGLKKLGDFKYAFARLPYEWKDAITKAMEEYNKSIDEAKDESNKKQQEMLTERSQLLSDFAFTESQNERSNRMKKIREIDKGLAEERDILAKQLEDLRVQYKETQKSINESFKEQHYQLLADIEDAEKVVQDLWKERMDIRKQAYIDNAKVEIDTAKELGSIMSEMQNNIVDMKGLYSLIIADQKTLAKDARELNELQLNYADLMIAKQIRIGQTLIGEQTLRRDLNGLLDVQVSLLNKSVTTMGNQILLLATQRGLWMDIVKYSMIASEANTLAEKSARKAYDKAIVAGKSDEEATAIAENVYNIMIKKVGGAASGGIVTKPSLLNVGENSRPEAIIPLNRLPEMMDSIVSRMPTASNRNIVINLYDTLDLRGSVGALNNPSDVDKFYRNAILPAKKRNVSRYRNIMMEAIT